MVWRGARTGRIEIQVEDFDSFSELIPDDRNGYPPTGFVGLELKFSGDTATEFRLTTLKPFLDRYLKTSAPKADTALLIDAACIGVSVRIAAPV